MPWSNLLGSSNSSSGRRNQDRPGPSTTYVPPTVTYTYSDDPYRIPRAQPQPQPQPIPTFPVFQNLQPHTYIYDNGVRAINTGWSTYNHLQRSPLTTYVQPPPARTPYELTPENREIQEELRPPLIAAQVQHQYQYQRRPIPILRPGEIDPRSYSDRSPPPPPPYTDTRTDTPTEDVEMSRASSRPTHIAMPTTNGVNVNGGRSPNGSPQPTPHGATSPTSPRSSFLPSFIRTRSRAGTLTGGRGGRSSPTVEASNPLGGTARPGISRNASNTGETTHVTRSVSTPQGMAQAANNHSTIASDTSTRPPVISPQLKATINAAQPPRDNPITTYRIRLVPHLESTRSLAFDPVTREMLPIKCPAGVTPTTVAHNLENVPNALNGRPPALILKVGRFTEKTTTAPPTATTAAGPSADAIGSGPMSAVIANSGGGGNICSSRVAFKSKVVSRSHAEIWCESNGKVS